MVNSFCGSHHKNFENLDWIMITWLGYLIGTFNKQNNFFRNNGEYHMKSLVRLSSVALVGLMFSGSLAQAACYCACINNKEQKVCENTWDSNYVYCSGTYCSGAMDLPSEFPNELKIENLFALLDQKEPQLISKPVN